MPAKEGDKQLLPFLSRIPSHLLITDHDLVVTKALFTQVMIQNNLKMKRIWTASFCIMLMYLASGQEKPAEKDSFYSL